MSISLVTVVFKEDFPLLLLQAKSLQVYMPASMAKEIIVIDNDMPGSVWRQRLLLAYGSLAPKVRIIPASHIAPIRKGIGGWFKQQILKLEVYKFVNSPNYVCLDAKNHLVFPLPQDAFIRNGKLRTRWDNYTVWSDKSHRIAFTAKIKHAGDYFHTQCNPKKFPPPTTPAVLNKAQVHSMLWYMSRRGNIAEEFCRIDTTEFILYYSWLISKGKLINMYEFTAPFCPVIWDSVADWRLKQMIAQAKPSEPFFSVHRRAWNSLSEKKKHMLWDFWYKHGLPGIT
jgi:Family of unknown function (DUF6492)